MSSRPRYFPNTTSPLLKETNPKQHMITAITKIIETYPPTHNFNDLGGIYIGPTSIAYLGLYLSAAYPDLQIASHHLSYWASAYISAPNKDPIDERILQARGIVNENFAAACVGVAIKQDDMTISAFQAALSKVLEVNESIPCEYIFGHAGTLLLLRIVAKWAPALADEVKPAQEILISRILAIGPPWFFREKQNLGPGHGEIGILTQVVLTDPKRAKELEPKLIDLLGRQLDDGNWPHAADGERRDLVHWCHGAPGFVVSLMALREYFPDVRDEIDAAIKKGRELIWEKGVLRKEPNLCDGTTGNALALVGAQREHFMAQTTDEFIEEGIKEGKYEENSSKCSLMAGMGGQVWGWLVVDKGLEGEYIGYDVV